MFPIRTICAKRYYVKVTTPLPWVTQVNSRQWRKYTATTGGLTWIDLCANTSPDARLACKGNLHSTQRGLYSLWKYPSTPGRLLG
jgi:hypothetical protein